MMRRMSDGPSAPPLRRLIDEALAAPPHRLRFAQALESRFEADTAAARTRHLVLMSIIGTVLFMGFLISDASLIPDVFPEALLLRGLSGPCALALVILVLNRTEDPRTRELAPMLLALSGEVVIIVLFLSTRSPDRATYLDGTTLVLLYSNVVVQARFPYASGCTLLAGVAILVGLALAHGVSLPVRQSHVAVLTTVSTLTLITNFRLERRDRRNYLMGLREALRNEDLASSNQMRKRRDVSTAVFR